MTILIVSQIILICLLISQFFYFRQAINKQQTAEVNAQKAIPPKAANATGAKTSIDSSLVKLARKSGNTFHLQLELRPSNYYLILHNQKTVFAKISSRTAIREWQVPLKNGEHEIELIVLNPEKKVIFSKQYRVKQLPEKFSQIRQSIERISTNQKKLAFTFDGGSDSSHTRNILQLLRQNEVQCTIFLTGQFMEKYPDLLLSILSDGHEVGNHLYNHPHLTTYAQNRQHHLGANVNREFIQRQLQKTDSIFTRKTNKILQPFWRAPYGEYNSQILDWAAELGYRHIRWTPTFDTFDWVTDQSSKLFRTPSDIFTHFLDSDKKNNGSLNGAIILMHLGSKRKKDHVYESLGRLIPELKSRNYQLLKISDMLYPRQLSFK